MLKGALWTFQRQTNGHSETWAMNGNDGPRYVQHDLVATNSEVIRPAKHALAVHHLILTVRNRNRCNSKHQSRINHPRAITDLTLVPTSPSPGTVRCIFVRQTTGTRHTSDLRVLICCITHYLMSSISWEQTCGCCCSAECLTTTPC